MKMSIFKRMILIAFASTIVGQVYMKPFGTDFRISLGVILLTILLLRFKQIPILFTCLMTAIIIFVFRTSLDFAAGETSLIDVIRIHLPAVSFYLTYGFILESVKVREVVSKPIYCIALLMLADVFSNTVELFFRGSTGGLKPEIVSVGIVLTALVRSLLIYILYFSEKFYSLLVIKKEKREQYKAFLMMGAGMKSEIFFMEKSMEDMEISMKESFEIYRSLNEGENLSEDDLLKIKQKALGVSKGIHEIKKDYGRIMTGLSKLIPETGYTKYKSLKELLEIIVEVTQKTIEKSGKNITFESINEVNFMIANYSPLLSVFNNLIINAIDAIDDEGKIELKVYEEENYLIIRIVDNGSGIKEKNLDAIFQPGFSTKFQKKTGKMSTGIGLTHVKHIVERTFKGDLKVFSKHNEETIFIIKLKKDRLCQELENE